MGPITIYSPVHVLIWYLFGKYTKISWIWFFILSIGWEIIELIISFYSTSAFFPENNINRLADIVFNILGFYLGRK